MIPCQPAVVCQLRFCYRRCEGCFLSVQFLDSGLCGFRKRQARFNRAHDIREGFVNFRKLPFQRLDFFPPTFMLLIIFPCSICDELYRLIVQNDGLCHIQYILLQPICTNRFLCAAALSFVICAEVIAVLCSGL